MSSSSSALRHTVLRGAAARRIDAVPFDFDLDLEQARLHHAPIDPATAAEELASAQAAGFDAGYQDGYAAGLAAAEAQARVALQDQVAMLEQAVRALSNAALDLSARAAVEVAEIEDQVADAAFAVAEAVIGRELEVATNPGRDAVARALALAPAGGATVRLHPADVATIDGDFGRQLTVLADPTIEPGGCVVEVGACTIDAQIGAALERVREALR